jgi:predicted permease
MSSRKEPLWRRYLRFFGPDVDADVEEELRFHLEMRERQYLASGMTPQAAREVAERKFGDFDRHRRLLRRQDARRLRRDHWSERLDGWRRDVRFALRTLGRQRGFSLAVIGTLSLGIGATTAMFSAVDAALLRPLPFPRPRELVELRNVEVPFREYDGQEEHPSGAPTIRDAIALGELFSGVGAYAVGGLNLSGTGTPIRTRVGVVTTGLLPTLGVRPAFGRLFLPEEGNPGNATVALISHGLWQRQFGGDSALPRSVLLNSRSYRIVGIMPQGFTFPEGIDLWIPLTIPMTFETFEPFRGAILKTVVARLSPGASLDAARDRMRQLWARLPAPERGESREVLTDPVRPLQGSLVGERREPMLILLGATGLLLLIACVNATNLLLAHAATRERELAVRAVLGASRGRLVRQLLAQSLVLSVAGALGGLALAAGTLRAVQGLLPKGMLDIASPHLDLRLLAFAVGLAGVTGLGFGLWPALGAARTDAQGALKSGGGHGATAARRGRLRRTLVTAELALALVLLAGAGLMLKSFATLLRTDPGFQPERVAALQVVLDGSRAERNANRVMAVSAILERVRGRPSIEAAGAVNDLPMGDQVRMSIRVGVEGRPGGEGVEPIFARYLMASEGYFRTLAIPLVRGRFMRETDDSLAPRVAVINETMARTVWPGEDPIGKRFRSGGREGFRTVVGIVRDVRERMDEQPEPHTYFPISEFAPSDVTIVARGALAGPDLLAALRRAVHEADPTQAVYNVRTLADAMSRTLAPRRSNTLLITVFGLLALLLSLVGVYGVVSYTVTLRQRELGIRAALGASRRDLARMVLAEGIAVAALGIGIGLVGAFALSRVLRGLLYGVEPTDPAALFAAAAALFIPAILATLIPARRAGRLNPVDVMRAE